MLKQISLLVLSCMLISLVNAKEVKYPEDLHGYVNIRSNYVPTPCEVDACNAVTIEMVKEFYDHLNDSNREYKDFELYPAKLQRIAKSEHSALSYSMFDMTSVVKNNVNQKKLAEIVNDMSQVIKSYYKKNDLEKNINFKIQFSLKASNKETKLEFHYLTAKEEKNEKITYLPIENQTPLAKELGQFFLNHKNPIITDSEREIEIKFENSYITNNYDYISNPQ